MPSLIICNMVLNDYKIQAFRGVGKSWITGAFVLWTLFKDKEKKIMIISASKERADNMSIFLQKLIIETPWLNHLQPKWGRSEMESHQFRRELFSSPGPICQERWDYGPADWQPGRLDGSGRHRSTRQQHDRTHAREKLLQLCTEAESILTPKNDSRILFLGTPQTTFTVYRKLAERNYRPFVWPARYPRT